MLYGVARASAVMVTVTVGAVMSATNRRPPAWLAADRSEPAKLARLSVNQPVAAARQRGLGRRRSGPSSPEPTPSVLRPASTWGAARPRPVVDAAGVAGHDPSGGRRAAAGLPPSTCCHIVSNDRGGDHHGVLGTTPSSMRSRSSGTTGPSTSGVGYPAEEPSGPGRGPVLRPAEAISGAFFWDFRL